MAATATLPSARRHHHQIALVKRALVKTALVKTALSPCERHAGVKSFGLGLSHSEVFEWIKSSSLMIAAGMSSHRNSVCVAHTGPKRTW